ncbi:MAG: zinc dependent phospholipase C family protein [Bacteroidota bacterium]
MRICNIALFCFILHTPEVFGWGFAAHKQINRHAVFTLPPAMFTFYKHYLAYITENAVNPDKRRYVVEGEAPKHYIDIDYYGDGACWEIPRYWHQAVEQYPEDTLLEHGILPWHILRMKHALTEAFRQKDGLQILKLSADIGHYLADANVPLHTSQNYDGQLTNQHGIHGLWETRLPELFGKDYDFFIGQAVYVHNPQQRIWEAIIQAHSAVDSVLCLEKELTSHFSPVKKYSFEQKGSTLRKVYAEAYAQAYHLLLEGQVERQMRASIKMIGDFWFTCWADAGKPQLDELLNSPLQEQQLQETLPEQTQLKVRTCGD